ncbi:hypothetical protein Lalb_Chr03g0031061 [Lupinus albus]|uniref:CLAVATA3/ESR (CLE)-related protein 45 n=1 Tax=Lupinus albus TaxID=3870 RepID=A0A6A4QT49_LUPAL|nr:hypothetical protein Lalb_Chr03g0031061 [Lupinus albus]
MTTSINSRVFILFIITTLTLLVVSSEARIFTQFSTMAEKINLEIRLRELINNVRNNKSRGKRSMLDARLDRVSPRGPDSQHH